MASTCIIVVIPLFNKGDVVERAVSSVLAQSHQDWKLVLVDDGSTDDGATRIKAIGDPRSRSFRGLTRGLARLGTTTTAADSAMAKAKKIVNKVTSERKKPMVTMTLST